MLSWKFWFCHCFSKFGDRFSWHTFQFILRTYMGRIGQTCFNQQCDFITVYSHEYAFDFNVKLKRMSHRSNAFHMLHYFFFIHSVKIQLTHFRWIPLSKTYTHLHTWYAFNTKFMSSLIFTLTHKSLCWPLNILVNQNALNSQDLLLEKKTNQYIFSEDPI